MPIHFFQEDTEYEVQGQQVLKSWLTKISSNHQHKIEELNYIFCSDVCLLKINQDYLQHDYLTDIITFDHSENEEIIEGDIYISIDRVKENATSFDQPFLLELHRVMAHGLLHLLGFNDKTISEKNMMTEKEEACLSLLNKISST